MIFSIGSFIILYIRYYSTPIPYDYYE